jgi:hypothetical protein
MLVKFRPDQSSPVKAGSRELGRTKDEASRDEERFDENAIEKRREEKRREE